MSTEIVKVFLVPVSLMSSLDTPGNSIIAFICPFESITSVNGSRSSVILSSGLEIP